MTQRATRIEPTEEGPRLSVNVTDALKLAAVLGRWLNLQRSSGARLDADLVQLHRRAVATVAHAQEPAFHTPRFRPETESRPSVVEYVSPAWAARELGISPQIVRRRCDRGEIPGAVRLDHGTGPWLIPSEYRPPPEDE